MRKFIAFFATFSILSIIPVTSSAEVVSLECTVVNNTGKTDTWNVAFDPDAGWANDGSIRMGGAVTAKEIRTLLVKVDRQSGEFTTYSAPNKEEYKGSCKKVVGKF